LFEFGFLTVRTFPSFGI